MITDDQKKLIAFWTTHVEKKQAAGMSRAEYCRNNNLVRHQMTYWERRLRSLKKKKQPNDMRPAGSVFAKAVIIDKVAAKPALQSISESAPIRLKCGSELLLELSGGIDPIWVANLINTMRRV